MENRLFTIDSPTIKEFREGCSAQQKVYANCCLNV